VDKFEKTLEIPVQWGDMDSAQHVNNVVYLKWIESARVNLFYSINGNQLKNEENIGPIVAWQDCKYIRPVNYPDTVIVHTSISEILDDRIILEAKIFSKVNNHIVAVAKQHIMAYDYKLKQKAPLPYNWIYNES